VQAFVCPECGQRSVFDPRVESALCPHCGFKPPTDGRRLPYLSDMQRHRYRPLLAELVSHWGGTYVSDATVPLPTDEELEAVFGTYRRALGRDLHPGPGREQMLAFAAGYVHLRRGEREQAAQHFQLLTSLAPEFGDAWVWLTVTTDDPTARQAYLETALRAEPDHPLAREALAIVRGEVPAPAMEVQEQVALARCPQCGGGLLGEPGATGMECPTCGAPVRLPRADRQGSGEESKLAERMRLRRHDPRQRWAAVQRVLRCQVCGAESTVPQKASERCAFCGSADLLIGDEERDLEQPDGLLPFRLEELQALDAIRALQQPGVRGLRRWWVAWASQELGCRYFPARLTSTLQNLKLWWEGRRFQVASVAGLYLPFWVFDGTVEICWVFGDGVVVPEVTEHQEFKALLFPGVDSPSSHTLQRLYPFDQEGWEPYELHVLGEWPVRISNVEVEVAADRARDLMLGLAKLQVQLQSRATATREKASSEAAEGERPPTFRVLDTTYRSLLVPVWVAVMERKGKQLLALVNGQSGRVVFGPALSEGRDQHDSEAGVMRGRWSSSREHSGAGDGSPDRE
jgi:predicted RNA-binding Zn-ribbon protein involved in translation (DUF1610 family)